MRLATPRLQLFGAIWFAAAAGICLPLSLASFPGPESIQLNQLIAGVWSGIALYGVPAAISGALLARWIVETKAPVAFALGALAVLLTAALAGPWLALLAARRSGLSAFATDALAQALGQIAIDIFLLRGVPLLLGGLVAIGLKAAVAKYPGVATHER